MSYYILDGETPVIEHDVIKWAKSFESDNRIVAKTVVGQAKISTVFLGIDHQHDVDGPPLLFETMIFGGKLDQEQWRYSTMEQARGGMNAL